MSDVRRHQWLPALILIASCTRHEAEPSARIVPLPELPHALLATPVIVPVTADRTAGALREPRVDIDTHGRDEDVRPLLEIVARAGGYRLVYPTSFNRPVRVTLTNVPVSVALATLLEAAGLTLESATAGVQPATRPVVFYELPVNVDSLPAEAIVKRFGVGPAIAEMIVISRGKP